jgi:hypothetical protein
MIRTITEGIILIMAMVALVFGLNFGGYALYSYFAPMYRATDYKTFKESEQYNDGMVRDLENLQMEYNNADAEHKQALRAIVLHRFSVYPEDRMPPNLRNFYNQLKAGQ